MSSGGAALWIGGSAKVAGALRELGAEAIDSAKLTAEAVTGRRVIIAPSAAKRDPEAAAARDAKRALRLGARSVSVVAKPPYGSDAADYIEEANGHASLTKLEACARIVGNPAVADAASERDEFSAALRTAQDVMKSEAAPPRYCVAERVPCGLVIIGARPKFRKSWYALQLAIAKAHGGRFMGVDTAAGRVLCLFYEDNDRRMRQRLEFFGITRENAPDNLHLVYDWPTGALGVEKIKRWMERFPDTTLIVVDVLQRFRGPRDRNASVYEADYQTMGMLQGVTQLYDGLTVLVVHHVKKGGVDDPVEALNGSFGIAGAADAFIILRRGAEKEQVIAHVDGRDWESWEHEFVWEFRQGEGWAQIGVNEGDLTATQQEIVRFARANEYITPSKLAEFRQINKSTAHEALQGLVTKGALRVFAGKYYPNGSES